MSAESSREPLDGPCAIKRGPWGASYTIGLIVRETTRQTQVREYWDMGGGRWTLMTRPSHWKRTEVLIRTADVTEARARVQQALAAHRAHEPMVEAAQAALEAARKVQQEARLAALLEPGEPAEGEA